MRIPKSAYAPAHSARKMYWEIFKPETYGVKGLIIHPDDPEMFLAVRQSYGNGGTYTLPGGGYKPSKETPAAALKREISHETGLYITDPTELFKVTSDLEGKRDTISLMATTAMTATLNPNNELAEAVWTGFDRAELRPDYAVSNFIMLAIDRYRGDV